MIAETLSVLYFFIPAYLANMIPVFVRKLSFLDYPLDMNATFRGKRVLGANKTFRGLFFGVVIATIAFLVQRMAYTNGFTSFALVDYTHTSVLVGAIIGFGALLGDAIESVVKRQLNRKPGKPFFPWDQLDFMIGSLLFTIPYWIHSWLPTIIAIVIIVLCDVMVQRIGYWTKLKDDPL